MTTRAGIRSRPARLPVSGRAVLLLAPTGADDLLMLEAGDDDLALALALMRRLARPVGGETGDEAGTADWSQITAADLDVFVLRLRQSVLGDRITADVRCRDAGCGQRIDLSFGIDEFIAHQFPSPTTVRGRGWSVEPSDETDWIRLHLRTGSGAEQSPVLFRLPTVADSIAVADTDDPAEAMAARCIRPGGLAGRQRRAVEAAMEAAAPILSQELAGTCPDCGTEVRAFFDPRRFCLRELRDRAVFIYQDIDVIARRYHWAESDILALPRARRMQYADAARQEGNRY